MRDHRKNEAKNPGVSQGPGKPRVGRKLLSSTTNLIPAPPTLFPTTLSLRGSPDLGAVTARMELGGSMLDHGGEWLSQWGVSPPSPLCVEFPTPGWPYLGHGATPVRILRQKERKKKETFGRSTAPFPLRDGSPTFQILHAPPGGRAGETRATSTTQKATTQPAYCGAGRGKKNGKKELLRAIKTSHSEVVSQAPARPTGA